MISLFIIWEVSWTMLTFYGFGREQKEKKKKSDNMAAFF